MKKLFLLFLLLLVPLTAHAEPTVSLPVPFTSEIPDGRWTGPWKNACEEASATMVEQFYLGRRSLTKATAKQLMRQLFSWEDIRFGSNADSDATRTAAMINEYSSFDATIQVNPTLENIKNELTNGHPVISLHYGYGLNNPLHRFRAGGSSYHQMVLIGFDESTQEFVVNDPELPMGMPHRPTGLDYRYSYATILSTLHDFSFAHKKADGPPTVLFTQPKQIVHAPGDHHLYLVRRSTKYYIAHPKVFKNHRWSWELVRERPAQELNALTDGGRISK